MDYSLYTALYLFITLGTCFSDPDECKLNGLTIYMWIKIDSKELKPTNDEYILSTGGHYFINIYLL